MTVISASDRFGKRPAVAPVSGVSPIEALPNDDTGYEYRLINIFVAIVALTKQGDKATARRLLNIVRTNDLAPWIELGQELGGLVESADVGSVVFPDD